MPMRQCKRSELHIPREKKMLATRKRKPRAKPKTTKIRLSKATVKQWYVIQVVPGQEAYATRQLKRYAKVVNTKRTKYVGRIITPKSKVLTVKKIPQYEVQEVEEWERQESDVVPYHQTVLVTREQKIPTGNHFQHRIVAKPKDMPGYLIVQVRLRPDVLEKIQEKTPGVIGFLPKRPARPSKSRVEDCKTDDQLRELEAWTTWKPIPLSRKEIMPILQQQRELRAKAQSVNVPFEIGDSCRINAGAFAGQIATVLEIDKANTEVLVTVSLTMLGRVTTAKYNLWQLKTI